MKLKSKVHGLKQIVTKLQTANEMRNAGKDLAAVQQGLEVSEAKYYRWRNQYGGMTSEEAKRLKQLEAENRRLKEIVAELPLDNRMLKHLTEGNGQCLPGSERRLRSCIAPSMYPSEGRVQWLDNRVGVSVIRNVRRMMSSLW